MGPVSIHHHTAAGNVRASGEGRATEGQGTEPTPWLEAGHCGTTSPTRIDP